MLQKDQKKKWKTKLQHLSRACMMDRLEEMMTESNTKVLDSVSQQIRGMNTTIGKIKDESDERYNKMDEILDT